MKNTTRDKIVFIGFLLLSGLLIFLGRNLLIESVLVTNALTFGGVTAASVLLLLLYRVRSELRESRSELARKSAELNFAYEVQKALFPKRFPEGKGLEFRGVCIPARGISGDFYDALDLPDGRLMFAIADISGKGISAAILMANLQALLRREALGEVPPHELCQRLNHHFHQVSPPASFATLFYAEWRPREGQLRYVNAGHNQPLLFRNGEVRHLSEGGFPLGIFEGVGFETGCAPMSPGDLLLLYSDGLTECANEGEEFGCERLIQIVSQHAPEPLQRIQEGILKAVGDWSEEPHDDMTLLLVRAVVPGGKDDRA